MNNPRDTTEFLLGQIDQNVTGLKEAMDRIEGKLSNQNKRLQVLEALKTRMYYMAIGAGGVIAIAIQGVKAALALVYH